MRKICKSAERYAAEHGIRIRERTEDEMKDRKPECPYVLSMDFFVHWEFLWDGRYRSMREDYEHAMSW